MEDSNDYLPNFEELPEFTDSTPSTSSRKLELPSFEEEIIQNKQVFTNDDSMTNEEMEDMEVPRPPPELKQKFTHLKLQDIEDEYLDKQTQEEDLEETRKELKSFEKKPVFVNVNDYGTMLSTVKGTKTNFKLFIEKFTRLDEISTTKDSELDKIQKHLEHVQRKLITIDNKIFERLEGE